MTGESHEKDAEIARLTKAFEGIQASEREKLRKLTVLDVELKGKDAEIARLKMLISRAAAALATQLSYTQWSENKSLVQELLEAQE